LFGHNDLTNANIAKTFLHVNPEFH
jgi:hypothetical protein